MKKKIIREIVFEGLVVFGGVVLIYVSLIVMAKISMRYIDKEEIAEEIIEEQIVEEEKVEEVIEEVIEEPKEVSRGNYEHKEYTEYVATAYCSCEKCCGKWSQYNKTASGTTPKQGRTIAVDKNVIPLGTKVYIEGYGEYIAEDTGSGIKGNRIDVYFESHQEALNFGRRTVKVSIID